MRTYASLGVLAPLFLVACATAPAPAPAMSGGVPAESAAAPLATICRAEHVEGSSTIYLARDQSRQVTRYSVTPSKPIATRP